MNHASHPQARMRWADFPWAYFLLGSGTVLINAGFLVACWRMMHLYQDRQSESAEQTHKFHVQLLEEFKQIASHSPVRATEDLCQVRFRLRFPDGISSPLTPMRVQLLQRLKQGEGHFKELHYRIISQPLLNFGFLPPGEYRLALKNSLGLRCDHDFRVLPGVPVDRVAYCPSPPVWHQKRPPFPLRIQPVWPAEWDSEPIVAVYHLEAGGSRIEGWDWQAPDERRFHQWVVAGNLRGEFSEAAFRKTLPEALCEHALPPKLAVLSDGPIPIPYGRVELTAISFVLDKTLEKQGYVYLGTCRFAGERFLPEKIPTDDAETILPQAAPWWDIVSQPAEGFPIEIPRAMIRQAVERAKRKLGDDSTPVSGSPTRNGPIGLHDGLVSRSSSMDVRHGSQSRGTQTGPSSIDGRVPLATCCQCEG